jgi:hypothetical protein
MMRMQSARCWIVILLCHGLEQKFFTQGASDKNARGVWSGPDKLDPHGGPRHCRAAPEFATEDHFNSHNLLSPIFRTTLYPLLASTFSKGSGFTPIIDSWFPITTNRGL